MYLTVTTRRVLAFSVSYLSRYLDKPTLLLWKAGKRILRYICATKNLGVLYKKSPTPLEGYSDADWAGNKQSWKSVSGFVCFHAGNPIAWHSKKQKCLALSSMEVEYISAGLAAQELVNLSGVLSEILKVKDLETGAVFRVDNVSSIAMMHTYENSKRGNT